MEVLRRMLFGLVLAAGLVVCIAGGVLLANVLTAKALMQPRPPPPENQGQPFDPFKNYYREAQWTGHSSPNPS